MGNMLKLTTLLSMIAFVCASPLPRGTRVKIHGRNEKGNPQHWKLNGKIGTVLGPSPYKMEGYRVVIDGYCRPFQFHQKNLKVGFSSFVELVEDIPAKDRA